MKETTVQRLDALFQELPVLVAEGVGDDAIEAAEKAIGTHFVEDYRWFLRRYGGAMVNSVPIFGLRWSEAMWESTVVSETLGFRKRGWRSAESLTVMSVDGAGNPIGIAKDGRVWISDHDVGMDSVIAASFEDFLVGILDGRIL